MTFKVELDLSQHTQPATPEGVGCGWQGGETPPLIPRKGDPMPRKSRAAAGNNSHVLRHHAIRVFVSDSEYTLLRSRAGRTPLSGFLRRAGLGVSLEKNEALMPIVQQIARVGNNLNQIARALNIGNKTGSSIHLARIAVLLVMIERDLGNVLQDFLKRQGKSFRD